MKITKLYTVACVWVSLAAVSAFAQTFTTLYNFCSQAGCSDGAFPTAALVRAGKYFYGTTCGNCTGSPEHGTVFRMTTRGALKVLHRFCVNGCTDGEAPTGGLVLANDGNLYGTTQSGGSRLGFGTIFKITPRGSLTTVHTFCTASYCPDGAWPTAGLVQGTDGNLYGATELGGGMSCHGTVFKMTLDGAITTLHSFCVQTGCEDGENPAAALIQATDGSFYGTTVYGGVYGGGTVFRIDPKGTFTTLYSFCGQAGCADGANPYAALVQIARGDLYGATFAGGASANCYIGPNSCGTIFKIKLNGALTTMHSFCTAVGCPDGVNPAAGLMLGTDGNLYGSTSGGPESDEGGGTLFQITPEGVLSTFYVFPRLAAPEAGLVRDAKGDLYGTTVNGGSQGTGTVFRIAPESVRQN